MSNHPRKINRAAAERLLSGELTDPRHSDPRHSHDLLAVLLAQAAAPAKAAELTGEEAAVAAFRDAHSTDAFRDTRLPGTVPGTGSAGAFRETRRGGDSRTTLRRLWTPRTTRRLIRHPAQLAVVALTATTAGGIALAASNGIRTHDPATTPSARGSATASQSAGTAATGRGQPGSPNGTPEPSALGLCRAYVAGTGAAPGQALDNPAFAALIKAAGGRDRVPRYCAKLLAPQPDKSKTKARSTAGSTPAGSPSGKAGQPSPQPTPGAATTPAAPPAERGATPPAGQGATPPAESPAGNTATPRGRS